MYYNNVTLRVTTLNRKYTFNSFLFEFVRFGGLSWDVIAVLG